jgi:hypothetical protein
MERVEVHRRGAEFAEGGAEEDGIPNLKSEIPKLNN